MHTLYQSFVANFLDAVLPWTERANTTVTSRLNFDGKAPSNLTGLTLLLELALRHDDRIDHMDDAVRGDYVSLCNRCIVNLYAASRINRNL